MNVSCVICGFGYVGKALAQLLEERSALLDEQYGISLTCPAIIASTGAAVSAEGLPLSKIAEYVQNGNRIDSHPDFGHTGYRLHDAVSSFEPGIMFEVTPTDIKTGNRDYLIFSKVFSRGGT